MSGESYNCVWAIEAEEFVGSYKDDDLQEMVDDLAKLGYADDLAQETMAFMLEVRAIRVRLQSRHKRLQSAWRALSYWQSCDSSEDSFKKALAQYRGEA